MLGLLNIKAIKDIVLHVLFPTMVGEGKCFLKKFLICLAGHIQQLNLFPPVNYLTVRGNSNCNCNVHHFLKGVNYNSDKQFKFLPRPFSLGK